ncbi:MAG: hypothetical protein LCI00_26040 [Chloroflexi bacterium]|nr:hypothetical protein [Chloroflexota bacterium]MCC6895314.1 hypothetical protein [Anaerolineae bacterium]
MRHLFIQDSTSPRTLRQLIVLLVFVGAALVTSDWLLGRVLPLITIEPPLILRPFNVPGWQALWRMNEAGIQPIVFTGSSQTYTSISPYAFDDRITAITGEKVQSVNSSVIGAVVEMQRDLIRNIIIPNNPWIIFYGIELRAVREVLPDQLFLPVQDFRNQDLGYAVSQAKPVEREILLWLLKHSNWVKYRNNLREWISGSREIDRQGVILRDDVDDLGFAAFPNTFTPSEAIFIPQFVPFSVDPAARQNLNDIRTDCQQNGVQCILINMPLHELAYQYLTPADEVLYHRVLDEAGFPIWDFNNDACRHALGDTAFYNLNHLNTAGATLFSQFLADVYASVFYGVPITSDATCAVITP